jgi:hypothetical protein
MIVWQVPAIVGGTTLIISDIRSQNYVTAVSGWAIFANGDAEFFNVFIRGNFSNGLPGTKHIEILQGTNSIDFYTGSPDEVVKGKLLIDAEAGVSGDNGFVRLVAPTMTGVAGDVASLELRTRTAPDQPVSETQLFSLYGRLGGSVTSVLWNEVSGNKYVQIDADGLATLTVDGGAFVRLQGSGWTDNLIADAPGAWRLENEIWHIVGSGGGEPAFAGNWAVSGGFAVGFYKDATGRVQLRGRALEAIAASTTIFTLPVGYHPSQSMSWPVKTNNDGGTISWLTVSAAGAVTLLGNVAQGRIQTILDAVSFPTF